MPATAYRFLPFALSFGLVGCASVEFYAQAVAGQASVLFSRRDIQGVIDDPATAAELAQKLRTVADLLRYAEAELALPAGGRYRSYVEVDRVPVWNVVAAPEFALQALPRCYPIIGCAVYRGYFSHRGAQREAKRLALAYDVQISGAAAYSTLGWFDDPVFSSFARYEDGDLANLIFHELAHAVIYLRDDSAFNESFAEFVGVEGALRWLTASERDSAGFRDRRSAAAAYADFLAQWRSQLAALYELDVDDDVKRLLKAEAFKSMRRCYEANRQHLGGGRYDRAMAAPFNNARLALTATYRDMVPAFAQLFRLQDGGWPAFLAAVKQLGALPKAARDQQLERLGQARQANPNEPIRCTAEPGLAPRPATALASAQKA